MPDCHVLGVLGIDGMMRLEAVAMKPSTRKPPLTREQRMAALEKAASQRRERESGGERKPFDEEWPDEPPIGDPAAMKLYDAAFR